MNNDLIMDNNRNYWNENADLWFGTTALPEYGVKFVTEDDLHLFGNVSGKSCLRFAAAGSFFKNIMQNEMPENYGDWISPKNSWIMRNPYYQKMVMLQS